VSSYGTSETYNLDRVGIIKRIELPANSWRRRLRRRDLDE